MGPTEQDVRIVRAANERRRRSRAARLGWIRSKRRAELQAAVLQAIDELRDDGYAFSALWPSGKPIEREAMARILYWNLQKSGAIQAESSIGYEELDDGRG